jgi:hypothetical protein
MKMIILACIAGLSTLELLLFPEVADAQTYFDISKCSNADFFDGYTDGVLNSSHKGPCAGISSRSFNPDRTWSTLVPSQGYTQSGIVNSPGIIILTPPQTLWGQTALPSVPRVCAQTFNNFQISGAITIWDQRWNLSSQSGNSAYGCN